MTQEELAAAAKKDLQSKRVIEHPYRWTLVNFAAGHLCSTRAAQSGDARIRIKDGKVVELSVEEEFLDEKRPELGPRFEDVKIPSASGKPIAPVPPELAPLFLKGAVAFSWSCL